MFFTFFFVSAPSIHLILFFDKTPFPFSSQIPSEGVRRYLFIFHPLTIFPSLCTSIYVSGTERRSQLRMHRKIMSKDRRFYCHPCFAITTRWIGSRLGQGLVKERETFQGHEPILQGACRFGTRAERRSPFWQEAAPK